MNFLDRHFLEFSSFGGLLHFPPTNGPVSWMVLASGQNQENPGENEGPNNYPEFIQNSLQNSSRNSPKIHPRIHHEITRENLKIHLKFTAPISRRKDSAPSTITSVPANSGVAINLLMDKPG